jgi:hypothetical protein
MGATPDNAQIGVAWIAINELSASRVYPSGLARALTSGARGYLGDIN